MLFFLYFDGAIFMKTLNKAAFVASMLMAMVLSFSAFADYDPNWGVLSGGLEMHDSTFDVTTRDMINGQEVVTEHKTETDFWNMAIQYKHQGDYGFARIVYKFSIDGDHSVTTKQPGISGCGKACGSSSADYWQMLGEVQWLVPVKDLKGKWYVGGRFMHSEGDNNSYDNKGTKFTSGKDDTYVSAETTYQVPLGNVMLDFGAGLGVGETIYKTSGKDIETPTVAESRYIDINAWRLELEAGATYQLARGISVRGYASYSKIFDSSIDASHNISFVSNVTSSASDIDSSEVFLGGMINVNLHDIADQTKDLYPKAH